MLYKIQFGIGTAWAGQTNREGRVIPAAHAMHAQLGYDLKWHVQMLWTASHCTLGRIRVCRCQWCQDCCPNGCCSSNNDAMRQVSLSVAHADARSVLGVDIDGALVRQALHCGCPPL